jgi:hypothetical protein
MPQTTLIRIRGKLYAYSFTTGVKPVKSKVRKTDDEIQALCLWLVNHGKIEEANTLLDTYCSQR